MKKFIAIIVMLLSAIVANAQFTGGTETKETPGEVIDMWAAFTKVFGHENDGYSYINILETPRTSPEGTIISTTLTLSLGSTKDECVQTLNAYKNLINSMEKGEWREITDSKTGITYNVIKQTKNMIVLNGSPTRKDNVLINNGGNLTISDIDNMLKKL